MSFEAYQKGMEERGLEIHELKEQMNEMDNVMKKLDSSMRLCIRNEFMYYVMKFGHPFDRQRPRKR
jgi:hypothetical protein